MTGNRNGARGGDGHVARAASAPDPLPAPDPLEAELSTAEDRIVVAEWSRRIPPVMARIPEVRIGRRWVSTLWIIPIGIALVVIGIAVAQHLRTYPAVEHFIATYPGQGSFKHLGAGQGGYNEDHEFYGYRQSI